MNKVKSVDKYEDGNIRRRVVFICEGESMTEQEHKDSCDIKTILKKFAKNGVWPADYGKLTSGDFTTAPDFAAAQNIFLQANKQFESLSSELRDRFGNSPQKWLSFMDSKDPDDIAESYRLKLRVKKEPVKEVVQKVIVVQEPQKEGK